jgi:hypothetical protein
MLQIPLRAVTRFSFADLGETVSISWKYGLHYEDDQGSPYATRRSD